MPDKAFGMNFKMGRKRPVSRGPRFRLKNYCLQSLPPPPAICDYTVAAAPALAEMYDNDQLGDCVIAGIGHVVGVLTGNAGKPFIIPDADIISLYSAIGGYVPGNPATDQGCDEVTALNYWENNGAAGHKIAGWMSVDATNQLESRTALYLFENLYLGVELPDAWINPVPQGPGFVWDVAGDPNPNNGHCFIAAGYDNAGFTIDTWGMLGTLTNAAMSKYAGQSGGGELYVVISEDAIDKAKQKAPNGFDFTQLVADFDSMGGSVKS